MRRRALIATLLLPLPFAALPLIGVLLGMSGGPETVVIDRRLVEDRQMRYNVPEPTHSLAYGAAELPQGGCEGASGLRSES